MLLSLLNDPGVDVDNCGSDIACMALRRSVSPVLAQPMRPQPLSDAVPPPRFWIGVASQDHVSRGVQSGFCQVCHGKEAPLRRMRAGDGIAYYSSVLQYQGNAKCQSFTAIGMLRSGDAYQVEQFPGFKPFRRDVDFDSSAVAAPIQPLLAQLTFIKDKQHWGGAFRFGVVEIPADDFHRIAVAMRATAVLNAVTPLATPNELVTSPELASPGVPVEVDASSDDDGTATAAPSGRPSRKRKNRLQ